MKVLPVSFGNIKNFDSNFLYTKPERKDKNYIAEYTLGTAFLALSAVMITLFNLQSKRKLSDSIVEIANAEKGLNRIKNQEQVIEFIKDKFIYPIKAASSGDKRILKSDKFNSGLIVTGKSESNLTDLTDALNEHFKELDFNTLKIRPTILKVDEKELKYYKKNELLKQLIGLLNKAQELYEQNGKYTLINLGNLDKMTNLKIVKNKNSSFDNLIKNINYKNNPGVIWIGWTTKEKSIPLFFNDLPILVTKLAE